MTAATAHLDHFCAENLPAAEALPEFLFEELSYPERINAAVELLRHPADSPSLRTDEGDWSYGRLDAESNRIARVLTEDCGLVAGNRVLLRGANSAELIAAWFGVLKAGGVVVTTMPLLRTKELSEILAKARVSHALVEATLAEELLSAVAEQEVCRSVLTYGDGGELAALTAAKQPTFDAVDTAAEDVALIAFTSGTTGSPKGCLHFHRDVLATCDTYGRHILAPTPDDVFLGTPPIAFTFGLGGLVLFPLRFGASSAPIASPSPDKLIAAIERHGATVLMTAPTMYRTLLKRDDLERVKSLRLCVSAGEPLTIGTSDAWLERTGLRIADGIGSTEMLHIFISAAGEQIRPGSTGRAVPGYRATVLGENLQPVPPGEIGRLAVKGPTGCRYLADERQATYVQGGWNLTGDAYRIDEDGYFWFAARADDMIVSSGYNISGLEVEAALLDHPDVAECVVVASPDSLRGHIVKAFVVPAAGAERDEQAAEALKTFVKQQLAPYKYPRQIEFVDEIPKTPTGKVQRFKLRQLEQERAAEHDPEQARK